MKTAATWFAPILCVIAWHDLILFSDPTAIYNLMGCYRLFNMGWIFTFMAKGWPQYVPLSGAVKSVTPMWIFNVWSSIPLKIFGTSRFISNVSFSKLQIAKHYVQTVDATELRIAPKYCLIANYWILGFVIALKIHYFCLWNLPSKEHKFALMVAYTHVLLLPCNIWNVIMEMCVAAHVIRTCSVVE